MSQSRSPRRFPLVNVVLFVTTVLSVTATSAGFFGDLGDGLVFAFALLPILLGHEMGHYILGLAHRMTISLPYFIPVPVGFGTLGAVIFIRSRFPNRNALVDVGAAGPLAGAALAIAAHVYGVLTAKVVAVPAGADAYSSSLVALLQRVADALQSLAAGAVAPAPVTATFVIRDSLLTKLLVWALRGDLPPGHDLLLSPALLASSAVLIITMLNLMPVGQFDGGHVAYAVLGPAHVSVGRIVLGVMVGLGVFFWMGWLVWAVLGWLVVRVEHPPIVDPSVSMTKGRKLVALVCLALLVLTFSPAPVEFVTT